MLDPSAPRSSYTKHRRSLTRRLDCNSAPHCIASTPTLTTPFHHHSNGDTLARHLVHTPQDSLLAPALHSHPLPRHMSASPKSVSTHQTAPLRPAAARLHPKPSSPARSAAFGRNSSASLFKGV